MLNNTLYENVFLYRLPTHLEGVSIHGLNGAMLITCSARVMSEVKYLSFAFNKDTQSKLFQSFVSDLFDVYKAIWCVS